MAQARQPHFYARLSVPDTTVGRFDMIALHAILLFHRFSSEDKQVQAFGQKVFDLFFQDMDLNLRELGIGDETVPKKIKKMAEVFYGGADAYAGALKAGDRVALAEALGRNILADADDHANPGRESVAAALAAYVDAAAQGLAAQDARTIVAGTLSWIDPDAFAPQAPLE